MNGHQLWHLACAARWVRRGGVIAYPTEGVYGLGCDPFDPAAVARLLALKARSWRKGLIVLLSDIEQALELVDLRDDAVRERVSGESPEPTTWLVPARAEVPRWLTGGSGRLAIRVTAHPLARALCRLTGPLVSTSANLAGARPARNLHEVRRCFGKALDYRLPGKTGGLPGPTPIRDAATGALVRVLAGPASVARTLT